MQRFFKNFKKNFNFLNPLNPMTLEDFIFFVIVIFFFIILITIFVVTGGYQGQLLTAKNIYSFTNILLTLRILLLVFIYIVCAQRFTALKRPRLGIILASVGILSYFFIYPIFSPITYFYLPIVIILSVLLTPYEAKQKTDKAISKAKIKRIRSKRKAKND